jgi:hypothetical protein
MITRRDIERGLLIKQVYRGDHNDIRIGVITDIRMLDNLNWVCNVTHKREDSYGFFFFEEDLKDIEIITQEEHPEYFL